ncbi:MAG: conjugative transfer system coupling protein TraD [Succinivibrionaceae bacterium]
MFYFYFKVQISHTTTFFSCPILYLILFIFVYRLVLFGVYFSSIIKLNKNSFYLISIAELRNKLGAFCSSNSIYLGKGFIWSKKHAVILNAIKEEYPSMPSVMQNPKSRGSQFFQNIDKARDIHIPLKFLDGHTLIVGTTGAGKTRLFDLLISQAIMRNESVIIIDPKGDQDLCNHTRALDKKRFLFFHPAYPSKSITLNPLYNFTRSTELASRISSLIPTMKGNNDPFKSFAFSVIDAIIAGLLIMNKRPTLKLVYFYANSRMVEFCFLVCKYYFDKNVPSKYQTEWDSLAKTTIKTPGKLVSAYYDFYAKCIKPTAQSVALENIFSFAKHDATHFGKMISSLISSLEVLCNGNLGELLSPDDTHISLHENTWDLNKVISQNKILYIGLDSLSDNIVASALGSLLLSDLAAVAGTRYNYGSNLNSVNIFVDETAEVINDQLIQLLNKGRGAKFRLTIATQTVADLSARLGDRCKAVQVLGNLNNLISLRVIDKETRDFVVDAFKKVRIGIENSSFSDNFNMNNPLSVSNNQSLSKTESESDIFPDYLLAELPDLEFLARVGGATLYKGKLPLIFTNPKG